MRLPHRTSVAALALVQAALLLGGLAAVKAIPRPADLESLASASTRTPSTTPPVAPTATPAPSGLPRVAPPRIPSPSPVPVGDPVPAYRLETLPEIAGQPACGPVERLPDPDAVRELDAGRRGIRDAYIDQGHLWTTSYDAQDPGGLVVRVEGVDLADGSTSSSEDLPGFELQGVARGSGWGVTEHALVQVDLERGAVAGSWSGDELAPLDVEAARPHPVNVVVSGETAYVLGWRYEPGRTEGSGWLAAVDVPSGELRWSRDLDLPFPGWSSHPGIGLATEGGDVFVAVQDTQLRDTLAVLRLGPDGTLHARTDLVVPQLADQAARVVLLRGSLYLAAQSWLPAEGDDLLTRVVRLDRTSLAVEAVASVPLGRLWDLEVGVSGVWLNHLPCDDSYLTHLDGITLRTSSTYLLPPYSEQQLVLTGDRTWLLERSDDRAVLRGWDGL